MAEKDTGELEHELAAAKGVEGFFEESAEGLRRLSASEYLKSLLAEKGLRQKDIVQASCLNKKYAQHIFAGRKATSRENLLALALAMRLTTKEAQRLLRYGNVGRLYVRDPWDGVVWYALEHGLSVMETNELLQRFSKEPLLGVSPEEASPSL